MHEDISDLLNSWSFDYSKVNARLIKGKDQKEKLQLRLDLGILQMELDGRPDGQRPEGKESWFEYYLEKKKETSNAFYLTAEDCARLHQEAVQYYHRYLSLFQLEDWQRVVRDTARNLEVFEFVTQYAENEDLGWMLQQFTPYVIMMNTRAQAMLSLKQLKHHEAIEKVQNGIQKIEDFFQEFEREEAVEQSPELKFLNEWLLDLKKEAPVSKQEKIQKQLAEAIEHEEYERAALLRDELESLRSHKSQ